jgi:CheY-like chemotaxis protein
MSHELRTPLNGILGMAELLRGARLAPQDGKRLDALHKAGEGLLTILNEVLYFAKLEEGTSPPEPVNFSIRQLLDEVLTLLEPKALDNDTILECRVDQRVADHHHGAEQYLRQVLSNLLANAIKFTQGADVSVDVALLAQAQGQEGQHLRVSVTDNGIGIAPVMQAKIFERFTQASEEVAQRYGGTGLGLAICKHLVEKMGGCIGVSSEVGRGSCFWFELTLQPAIGAVAPVPTSVPGPALDILVVEDVALNREVAEGLLQRDGHRVWLAIDAEQALVSCAARTFDLILLDVHLPGMSGVQLCQQIRGNDGLNRQTRILALTASVQPALVSGYLDAGMDGVLAKPLKLENLRQVLAGQAVESLAGDESMDWPLLQTHRTLLGEQKVQGLLAVLHDSILQHREALNEAIEADDCTEVAQLAHRLAGSGDSLGFRALAQVLRALEVAALGNDQSAIRALVPTVEAQLQCSMQTLNGLLQR